MNEEVLKQRALRIEVEVFTDSATTELDNPPTHAALTMYRNVICTEDTTFAGAYIQLMSSAESAAAAGIGTGMNPTLCERNKSTAHEIVFEGNYIC